MNNFLLQAQNSKGNNLQGNIITPQIEKQKPSGIPQFLKAIVPVTVAMLFLTMFVQPVFGQCSSADASGYTTWTATGSSDGGFGAWTLTTTNGNSSQNGHFIGNSGSNGSGSFASPNTPNINTSSKAFALYANSSQTAAAFRNLPTTMSIGQNLKISMDNGFLDNGGTVGIGIQNGTGNNLLEFYFVGGNSGYTINDASNTTTSIAFSDRGLDLTITMVSATTYDLTVFRKENSATSTFTGRTFANPAGGQVPARLRVFNFNAGGGDQKNAFFNNFSLCTPTIATTGTLTAVTTTYGTASTNTSFNVSGAEMVAGITVTAPTGFEVSTSSGSGFASSITLGSAGTIASTQVFVRLAATANVTGTSYNSQNVVLSSTGAANVNIATTSSGNTVSTKALSITAPTIADKVYNGSAAAGVVTVGTLSGFVGSQTVTATAVSAAYSSANAATYTGNVITYTLADGTNGGLAANYSLANGSATGQITAKALTITAPTIADKVYNGSAAAGAVTVGTLSGFVGSQTVTATAVSAAYSSANAATYTGNVITYTLADGTNGGLAANYSLANGSATGQITAKALTITAPTIADKVYNGSAAAGAVTVGTLSGFVGSQTVTATAVSAAYSSANAATYTDNVITYTLADGTNGGLAANYSLANGSATGQITAKALTITAPSIASKPYDGNTTAGAVTVGTLSGFVGSETVTATGAAANYSSANVGTYNNVTITYTLANGNNGGLATNYSLANGSATGQITAQSQSTADFRTKANGNFSATSGVWEYDQGGNAWADATQVPVANNVSLLHNITLDQNFAVANGKTLSIDAAVTFTINPNKVFSVPTGAIANFNARNVIVASNASGTGIIGTIAGTLNGASNVTVERYLPINTTSGRTGKAWRLLTASVTGTTVNAAWQGGSTWNGVTALPATGNSTLITGGATQSTATTANGNGFDWWSAIASATSSIRTHNGLGTGAWLTPANTTALNFVNNQGYLLYVRGDRSVSTGAANATTLRATGTLKQGGFTPAIIPNGTATFTLIGNPYASPINFESIYLNNSSKILPRFTIFDANLGLSGGYYLVERQSANNYTITPKPSGSSNATTTAQFIQSSQAIFVEASTNTANTLSIAETDKAAGGNASVFLQNGGGSADQSEAKGRTSAASLNINLNIKNADNSILLADGAVVRIGAAYNKAVTSEDATKTNNIAENLAIGVDNYNLISERRPTLGKTDTVFLKLWGTGIKNYQLEISGTNLKGRTANLIDSYLGTATPLNLDGSSNIINFSISSDAASKAINRFYIVTPGSAVTALKTGTLNEQSATTNAGAVSMKAYPNPATGKMVNVLISNLAKGSYSLSAFSSKGQQLFTRTIQHTGGNLTQDIALNNWSIGVYSLQLIDANGEVVKTTSIIVGQ